MKYLLTITLLLILTFSLFISSSVLAEEIFIKCDLKSRDVNLPRSFTLVASDGRAKIYPKSGFTLEGDFIVEKDYYRVKTSMYELVINRINGKASEDFTGIVKEFWSGFCERIKAERL